MRCPTYLLPLTSKSKFVILRLSSLFGVSFSLILIFSDFIGVFSGFKGVFFFDLQADFGDFSCTKMFIVTALSTVLSTASI